MALLLAPPLLFILTWVLTEGFSETPSLPPLFSKFAPLVLSLASALVALFAYSLAKDEEPDWGKDMILFKVLEGLALAYIALSMIFAALTVFTYFL